MDPRKSVANSFAAKKSNAVQASHPDRIRTWIPALACHRMAAE